ncbi:TPA: hypothetical protein U1025_001125 [Streptococcus suis]|nr:hypothetical protein [Streptococcus suis]
MNDDILPSLLKEVQDKFEASYGKSDIISSAFVKLKNKKATYATANDFALEVGDILAEALSLSVTGDKLPDGKMYYNIANRLLADTLGRNFELVSGYAGQVQKNLNKSAEIGLQVQVPEINQDRIDGLVNRLASEAVFDDVAWLLQEPIVNFTQSIVDDSIKVNAEFHEKAGLRPKIVRTSVGKCCKWCQSIAGSYDYPNVPHDVYRRHQNCRCTVNFKPGDGRRQNIWTKKVVKPVDSAIIGVRKSLNLKPVYDTSRYAHNIDGTVKVSRTVERRIPNDVKPFEVIDVINTKGVASRTYIDEYGRRGMRIDTSDHGQPKYHPMGAHKHIIEYDENGNYLSDGKPTVLSQKDRKESRDIL